MKKILGLIIFIIGILIAFIILIGASRDIQSNSLGALVIFDIFIIFVGYKLHKSDIKKEKVGEEK